VPFWRISKPRKPAHHPLAVGCEFRGSKSRNIFDQHGRRACFLDQPQGIRKKITFVKQAQLFAGDRKWRTGYTSGEHINAPELMSAYIFDVSLYNAPIGSVVPQRLASSGLDFDRGLARETRRLQAQGLSTAPSAGFQNSRHVAMITAVILVGKYSTIKITALGVVSRRL
jgi:hypothetical protein